MILTIPIPSAPGYFADSQGIIFKKTEGGLIRKKQTTMRSGYLVTSINGRYQYVHRLILLAFQGLPPTDKHETRHSDGVKGNNYWFNLSWGTSKQNHKDKLRHGTHQSQILPGRRLTDEQVKRILESPETGPTISKEMGVSLYVVNAVRAGTAYRHVDRSGQVQINVKGRRPKRQMNNTGES